MSKLVLFSIFFAPLYVAGVGWLFRYIFGGEEIHVGGIIIGLIAAFVFITGLDTLYESKVQKDKA